MAKLKKRLGAKKNEVINKLYKNAYKSTKRIGHVRPEDKLNSGETK